jgi:hypothetical protein
MKKYFSLAILLSVSAVSCKLFDKTAVRDITSEVLPDSRIKFFNFAPSTPKLNFYAGTTKMTAVQSTTGSDTLGVVYPSAAGGGLYSGIAAGSTTLTAKLATPGADLGLAIASVTQTIEKGKYYSYYLSGPYSTGTKTAASFIVEDPIPAAIDYTMAHIRIVNAVSDATGPLTLWAKNTTTLVDAAYGSAVAYQAAGTFVTIPEGTYDLGARYTGSATNVTGLSLTGQTFVGGRVYTISARGVTTTASTMGLSNTQNTR